LSYVHDFTDCPVDKAVLEYYEKEERIAEQHALTNCARANSNSAPSSDEPFIQHALHDCASDSTASQGVSKKHDTCAVDAVTEGSNNHRRGAVGHYLFNCAIPTEGANDSQDIEDHRLSSCIHDEPQSAIGSDDSQATWRPVMTKSKGKGKELVLDDKQQHSAEKRPDYTNMKQHKHDEKRLQHCLEHHSKKSKFHVKDGLEEILSQASGSQENPFESSDYKNNYTIINDKIRRVPKHSAQDALSHVLASQTGKRENSDKDSQLEVSRKGGARKTKSDEGSRAAFPDGETIGGRAEVSRSEEEQKGQSGGVAGLWSKMTGRS
jgi:hypothetical protein